MRLIDADALKGAFVRYVRTPPHMHYGDWDKMCISGTEIDEVVDNAPTIDAEPVRHGRWERKDEAQAMFDVEWRCSECGGEISTNGIYTPIAVGWYYCPTCGAKMDGGAE